MSLTRQALQHFQDRRLAAKWVLARRYIERRGLSAYPQMPMAGRVVAK
ncbi:MAG TPA: hypothetical protein VNS29_15350 [Burkholderiaceae bacterium]|nr:hypothetical protein [Burkholderiaceae bacterium]